MQEQLGLIDVYLRERLGTCEGNHARRLRRYITGSIQHFHEMGILSPVVGDFHSLREWIGTQSTREGKPYSKKSADEWATESRNFYNWLSQRRQINMCANEEREGLQDEPETPAVSENTSTGEENAAVSLEHEPVDVEPGNVEAHAMITGYEGQNEPLTDSVTEIKADTRYQSVEAVSQIVKSENKAKTQPRRGRKPKDEQERRSVKLSIYLTPKLYDGVEELASMLKQDVSEVVFTLLEDFVARNSEKMIAHQNFLASIGAIK